MSKKNPVSENDVKALIKDELDAYGAFHYPAVAGVGALTGIPDRVACVPVTITPEMVGTTVGLFVGIEAKRPGRRGEPNRGASGRQALVGKDIKAASGIWIVCDGTDDLKELAPLLGR